MADVFISYESSDREKARALVECLRSLGIWVFWDQDIPRAEPFSTVLQEELLGAACVIGFFTPASLASQWMLKEVRFALDHRMLIPVIASAVELPDPFRQLQAVDISAWSGGATESVFVQIAAVVKARARIKRRVRVAGLFYVAGTWVVGVPGFLAGGNVLPALTGLGFAAGGVALALRNVRALRAYFWAVAVAAGLLTALLIVDTTGNDRLDTILSKLATAGIFLSPAIGLLLLWKDAKRRSVLSERSSPANEMRRVTWRGTK